MTDSNGLYYMRARYYNVDIKRFINQDVLTGTIAKGQSLNRYSYVQGNPISLTDPFGLSPDISWKGIGHGILDLLGFIPVVGDVFDVVNAVWYASEGNYLEAMSCMVSALPGIGSFVGNGIKWGSKGAKTATKIADGIILTTKIASNTATLARGSYGVVVTGKKIYTDIKDGKGVSFGDVVKLGLNVLTVGISGKRLKSDISAGISSMKQAKQVEVADSGTPEVGLKSQSEVQQILNEMPELTGSNREKLLFVVQDGDLNKIVNEPYRPGATIGDGGTAIIDEFFSGGTATHFKKSK